MTFDIYVDADSVPRNLRPIILKASKRTEGATYFVADRALNDVKQYIAEDTFATRKALREAGETDEEVIKKAKSRISMIVVTTSSNSADDYIVQSIKEGDLCITHDIPLASRVLERDALAIDDRGSEYTKADISRRLTGRLVNQELRSWGVFSEQQGRMDNKSQKAFSDTLDKVLTRMERK